MGSRNTWVKWKRYHCLLFFSYIALNRDGNLSWERSLSLTLSPSHSHFIFSESTISNPLAFVRRSIQVSFFFLSFPSRDTKPLLQRRCTQIFAPESVCPRNRRRKGPLVVYLCDDTKKGEKKLFFNWLRTRPGTPLPSSPWSAGRCQRASETEDPHESRVTLFCSSLRSGVNWSLSIRASYWFFSVGFSLSWFDAWKPILGEKTRSRQKIRHLNQMEKRHWKCVHVR